MNETTTTTSSDTTSETTTTTSKPGDRRLTAVHEAGHIVAGVVLGFATGEATIECDGSELGYAIVENPLRGWQHGDGPRRDIALRYAQSLYAGYAAQEAISGIQPDGWPGDFAHARSVLAEHVRIPGCSFVGDDAFEAFEMGLRRKARALIVRHRDAVERVSAALLDRGTLPAEEARSLVLGRQS